MQLLRDIFLGLDGRQRLLAFICVAALSTLLLALWTKGIVATICITGALLLLIFITRPIWLPPNHGNTLVRRASLFIVYGTAVSFSLWSTLINQIAIRTIWPSLKQFTPHLPEDPPQDVSSISVMLFVLAGVFIVNFLMRDRSGMGQHPKSLESEFPEPAYRERLNSFCKLLRDELDRIDRETSWSEHFFTPLDAEVSVQREGQRYHRVTDLLDAIKRNRQSQAFLVLGDPGSGKSVALRKLSKDLLEEVERTGKVPIYINLREWNCPIVWSHDNPPEAHSVVAALNEFILANVRGRLDLFGTKFLEKYWQPMFEQGRLFFILDSFDEVSVLLDVDERSPLIDRLSEGVYRFVAGAHQSRGILSSRIFRRPTSAFKATSILEIRPLSDEQILTFVEKRLFSKSRITSELFTRRPDLVAVARNPFTAALLLQYIEDRIPSSTVVVLPDSRAELYRSYIHSRLEESGDRLNKAGLTIVDTVRIATEIATLMFDEPRFGFEAPLKELEHRVTIVNLRHGLDVLRFSRIIRIGAGTERISFAHRRFAEFFAAQRLIAEPQRLPHQAIPSDSRWRDSLVLYCEVADSEAARAVAKFCWDRIRDYSQNRTTASATERLEAVHCLRFLAEAFKTKQKAIADFQSGLTDFVLGALNPNNRDLLSMKIAVEAVGLLPEPALSPTLIAALKTSNPWICEVAFRACRYLPSVDEELLDVINQYLDTVSPLEVVQRRREYLTAFSLSNGLQPLYNAFIIRLIDILFLMIGLSSVLFVRPFLFSLSLLALGLISAIEMARSERLKFTLIRVMFASYLSVVVLVTCFFPTAILQEFALTIDLHLGLTSQLLDKDVFTSAVERPFEPVWSAMQKQWGLRLAGTTMGLVTILIFPVIPLVVRLKKHFTSILFYTRLLGLFGAVVFSILLLGAICFVCYLFVDQVKWILVSVFVCLCLLMSFNAIVFFRSLLKDLFLFRQIDLTGQVSRQDIHSWFINFRTAFFRYRFAKRIAKNRIRPMGLWPIGHAPNVKNDAASTLLAQLDEGWLMLDR